MNPIIGLSLGRIVVGLLFFLRPDLAARILGQDLQRNPELTLGARLFGSRDVALGAATLLAKGTARRNLVVAGIAVDAADAGAAAMGFRDQSVKKAPAVVLTGVALIAVAQGVASLRNKG
jgi:uncharacterized protein YjeT (DUF2065 family)